MTERRDTRVVAGVGVILVIDGKREPCMTRNIGRGGLFALTRAKLTAGQAIEVEIVHRGEKLASPATVASVNADGAGLKFVGAGPSFLMGVEALIKSMMTDAGSDSGAPPSDHVEASLAWAPLPDGRPWSWWKKRQHGAEIVSLTLDGAALGCKNRPQVGETVLIFLIEGKSENESCRAEVVRHTDRGFAVKFANPRMEFRRAVSRLRRGEGEV
jgi:hypothetical protein